MGKRADRLEALTTMLESLVATGHPLGRMRTLPPGLNLELVRAAYNEELQSEEAVAAAIRDSRPAYFEQLKEVLAEKPRWPLAVAASVADDIEQLKALGRLTVKLQSPASNGVEREMSQKFAADARFVEACRRIVMLAEAPFGSGSDAELSYPLPYLRVLAEEASEDSIDLLVAQVHRALTTEPALREPLRLLLNQSTKSEALQPLAEMLGADWLELPLGLD